MNNILKWFFGIVGLIILIYIIFILFRYLLDIAKNASATTIGTPTSNTSSATSTQTFSFLDLFKNMRPFQYAPLSVVTDRQSITDDGSGRGHTNIGSLGTSSYVESLLSGLGSDHNDFDARWGGNVYNATPQQNTRNTQNNLPPVSVKLNSGSYIKNDQVVFGSAPLEIYSDRVFPIFILDQNKKIIGTVKAYMNGSPLANGYIPFRGVISFVSPKTSSGYLVFGPEQNIIKINFQNTYSKTYINNWPNILYPSPKQNPYGVDGCVIGGCNMNLCVEQSEVRYIASTCEYRPQYACYKRAICERDAYGRCGWRVDNTLATCLQNSF